MLLSIGGETTDAPPALAHAIRSRQPGTNVELRIVRDGAAKVLSCTVGKRPEEDEDEEEQFPELPRSDPTNTGAFVARFDGLGADAPLRARRSPRRSTARPRQLPTTRSS